MSRKYFGSKEVLEENGAHFEADSENKILCMKIHGWAIFISDESPIADTEFLGQLEEETKEFHFPSMIFFKNFVEIKHIQTGIGFSLTPKDALIRWAELSKQFGSQGIKVPTSWRMPNRHSLKEINPIDFDWTFSTDFAGKLFSPTLSCKIRHFCFNHDHEENNCKHESETEILKEENIPLREWQKCEHSGIDIQMLSRRDPFLFFDEISMYRDELDEWGDVELSIKIRVMPTCWFVLQRYYLRLIDSSVGTIHMIKIFDVRFFHAFGTNKIHREITVREGDMEALVNAGLPSDLNYYKQIDTIYQSIPIKVEETAFHALIFD